MSEAPAVTPEPVPEDSKRSTTAQRVAGGAGGAVLVALLDQLLREHGAEAATFIQNLGPLLGPVWSAFPLLTFGVVVAALAWKDWRADKVVRAKEAAAFVSGLGGLREEVHGLRAALQRQSEHVDARVKELRDHVKSEIAPVAERVAALEKWKRRGSKSPARGTATAKRTSARSR